MILQSILKSQIVRGGQIKDRPTDIRLTVPHAGHDSVHVIYLQETVHFELCKVLEHCHTMHILLRQQRLYLVWFKEILIYRHEPLLNLILHKVDAEGQTPELLAHLHQNVGREHEPH